MPKELEFFHDAPPLHTHRHCKNCDKFRRFEGGELFKCAACLVYNYCVIIYLHPRESKMDTDVRGQSVECQRAHWPSHKLECKSMSKQRANLTAKTGNPQAYVDFMAWIEYHHTTLINCAVAAIDVKYEPGADEHVFLHLCTHYCNEPGQKMQSRFCSMSGKGVDMREEPEVAESMKELLKQRAQYVEIGKKQYGKDYGGTGMYMLHADFNTTVVPFAKIFNFDKATANAEPHPEYGRLYTEYITEGKKMRFCCGQIAEGICCCGGWTHVKGQLVSVGIISSNIFLIQKCYHRTGRGR